MGLPSNCTLLELERWGYIENAPWYPELDQLLSSKFEYTPGNAGSPLTAAPLTIGNFLADKVLFNRVVQSAVQNFQVVERQNTIIQQLQLDLNNCYEFDQLFQGTPPEIPAPTVAVSPLPRAVSQAIDLKLLGVT